MSTYSHFSQENDLEVFTNINSINPIDPDEGEGDTPVDLSRRVDAVFEYVPTDTAEYTDPIRPGLQSKINFLYDYWLPEDNDNAQHLDSSETYEPDSGSMPPNPEGIGLTIFMEGSSLRPGMPPSNYLYLSVVKFTVPGTEDIVNVGGGDEFTERYGSFYATGVVNGEETEVELKDGTILEDYAGNIYTVSISSTSFSISIDSTSSSWKPVDLSQLGLVYRAAEEDDEDVALSYSIQATNKIGEIQKLEGKQGFYVGIDAVADKPVYESGTA